MDVEGLNAPTPPTSFPRNVIIKSELQENGRTRLWQEGGSLIQKGREIKWENLGICQREKNPRNFALFQDYV